MDVKNDFAYVLQVFSLISDGLGSVKRLCIEVTPPRPSEISEIKLEHIWEVIFEIPFTIQSHAESYC